MAFQIAQTPRAHAVLILGAEGLGDGAQELLGAGDGHVGAEVGVALEQGLGDPLGQLGALFLEAAISQDHDAVVVFPAEDAAQALGGVAHGVEAQEVVLADAIRFAQELEAGLEDAGLGVLEGDPDAEHGAAVVVVEINALGDFPAGDAKQDGAPAVAAGGAVGLERQRRFLAVGRFDQDQLELPDLVQDAHALPHADDGFHVEVGGEEDDDAVGRDLGE